MPALLPDRGYFLARSGGLLALPCSAMPLHWAVRECPT